MKYDLKKLTLDEKITLLCGTDRWHTYDAHGKLPVLHLSDGPSGLRKEDENDQTVSATAMPTISTLANTWSREMAKLDGETIADDCLENNVDVLLAPGVNMKRTPLCGRNFEYFSEDPFLAGTLAKEYIDGVQSKGVGTSLKHYCANNCETERLYQTSEVDERTLREIYLSAFEIALKAQPYTVMCSYNLINGVYAAENTKYLKNYLRDEFGFNGLIVSDWGAYRSAYRSIIATLDLVMPYCDKHFDNVKQALEKGLITEEQIDFCVQNVLNLLERCESKKEITTTKEQRHENAVKIAEEGIVLLKNEGALPLKNGKILVSGTYSENPPLGGGGSSYVKTDYKQKTLYTLLNDTLGNGYSVDYANVNLFSLGQTERTQIACRKAYDSDTVILCVGDDGAVEFEGADRKDIKLSPYHENFILNVAKYNKNVVVVLYAGSAIDMSAWIDKVNAVVLAGYSGEGVNESVANILSGKVSPSGKLSETYPLNLESCNVGRNAVDLCERYTEGVFIGYRYYDTYGVPVLFPFGHGLSYATFEYSNLTVTKLGETDFEISYDVTNTSNVDAKEVSQIYVKDVFCAVTRPEKELKGFSKDLILAGQTKRIVQKLDYRSFAYYNLALEKWHVENGDFEIMVGASVSDIRLKAKISIERDESTQKSVY